MSKGNSVVPLGWVANSESRVTFCCFTNQLQHRGPSSEPFKEVKAHSKGSSEMSWIMRIVVRCAFCVALR